MKAPDRRTVLKLFAGAGLFGCGTGGPAHSCAAQGKGPGLGYCLVASKEITLPGLADLQLGEVALMALDDNSAAIVARDAAGFYALSGTCPHACCTVTLCQGDACALPLVSPADCAAPVRAPLAAMGVAFLCPCHGSQFAADGAVLSGPAKARLPSVALRIAGNDLVVDLSSPAPPESRVVPG